MRIFTKIGVTLAAGAVPVLLWAGPASAQQSQSQSQSQVTTSPTFSTVPANTGNVSGGTLARTGAEDLMPLAIGGVALFGALAVRRGLRRGSAI